VKEKYSSHMAITILPQEPELINKEMKDKYNKAIESTPDDIVLSTIDRAKPILAKISFGSIMGFCSGYSVKKAAEVAAVIAGAAFIAVQTCVSYGYIDVNWEKIKQDAINRVDADGDGKLGPDDLKLYWIKLRTFLTRNFPNSTGFSLGFFYGVKMG